jgi:hypothetical protein
VSKGIFAVYETIVINEILVTRIIRRINVNEVNLAHVGVVEHRKGVVVVAFYDEVSRI